MRRISRLTRWLPVLMLACLMVGAPACAASLDIEVRLDPSQTGVPIPLTVELSAWISTSGPWRLTEHPSGREVPCQMDTGRLRFVVESPVSDRTVTKRFRLIPGQATGTAFVRIEHTASKQLAIVDGGKPVMAYNYRDVLPGGVPDDRRRSCYFHPVSGLNGEVLSDDFPADHYHHRGLFWVWSHVKTGDKDYDLWLMRGIRQRFEKLLSREDGPVCASLKVANGWYTDDGKVMSETLSVDAYRAGTNGRIVDVELVLRPTAGPVTLDSSATGYGGFSIRFAPRTETRVHTSAGKLDKDMNRERFSWADLSAKFGGSSEFSGLAIFDNPGNPSHPSGWSTRFYGFLNPSVTGVEPVTIQPDAPLVLRYRIWIHKGDADLGGVARAYEAYAHPPGVKISESARGAER